MSNTRNIDEQLAAVNLSRRERLFHIHFKLNLLGLVNCTDLVSRFGIKEAAASRDLSIYKELPSRNI